MSNQRKTTRKAKPLPPLMAKAFADLKQAFDMSVPANLGDKFPFYVKGDEERLAKQAKARENRVRTASEPAHGGEDGPAYAQEPSGPARGCVTDAAELIARLTRMVTENPKGKKGVAQLLGVHESSMRTLLTNIYKGHPRKIMAAYNAYIEGVENQRSQVATAGPNPANLDSAGKRYVATGCMVELIMRHSFTPQQLSEAKERITCTGQSVAEWAREYNFDYQTTGHVLGGRLKALRGEAFRVSVALGLRNTPPKKHSAAPVSTVATLAR